MDPISVHEDDDVIACCDIDIECRPGEIENELAELSPAARITLARSLLLLGAGMPIAARSAEVAIPNLDFLGDQRVFGAVLGDVFDLGRGAANQKTCN